MADESVKNNSIENEKNDELKAGETSLKEDTNFNDEEFSNDDVLSENVRKEEPAVEIKYTEEEIAAKNRVAEAIRTFTHNFHESLANGKKGNFVCSGLSAHLVLSMAAQGVAGATAEQMQQGLSLPADQQQSCMGYQCYISNLKNAQNMIFKLANKVYVSSQNEIKEKFNDTTTTYFYSSSETVDFSNKIAAADEINNWCAKVTDDKIQNIFSARDIDENMNFVLLNGLYFKGVWLTKFLEINTKMKPYHINKDTVKEVPMMFGKSRYLFDELEDGSAYIIGLYYKNKNYCMFIIVPKEIDGLANVEKNYELIKKAVGKDMEEKSISLHLPKFKITSTFNLERHLCQFGMKGIFDANADFTGITNRSGGITNVRQKVFIEVNEVGTESLAWTDFLIRRRYWPQDLEIMVDRPFLYQVYDKINRIPLFSGRIIDPSI